MNTTAVHWRTQQANWAFFLPSPRSDPQDEQVLLPKKMAPKKFWSCHTLPHKVHMFLRTVVTGKAYCTESLSENENTLPCPSHMWAQPDKQEAVSGRKAETTVEWCKVVMGPKQCNKVSVRLEMTSGVPLESTGRPGLLLAQTLVRGKFAEVPPTRKAGSPHSCTGC